MPLVILATRRNMEVRTGEGNAKVPSMFTASEMTGNVQVSTNVVQGCSRKEHVSDSTQLSKLHPQKRAVLSRRREHHCARQDGEKHGKNKNVSERASAVPKIHDVDPSGRMSKSYITRASRKRARQRRRRHQIKKVLMAGVAYLCKVILRVVSTIALIYSRWPSQWYDRVIVNFGMV